MASINGVTIKAIKKFKGHEGEPLVQGNIYLNNKKLGFWSQDAWGGPDIFTGFAPNVLRPMAERYRDYSGKVEEKYKGIFDEELFLYKIAELAEAEKAFKKFWKQGFRSMIKVDGGMCMCYIGSIHPARTEEEKKKVLDVDKEKCVASFKEATPAYAHKDIRTEVFGPNDFDLNF